MPPRVYLHNPLLLFEARINLPAATYPLLEIPFDTVTVAPADMSALRPGMTVMLGDPPGSLGRQRIRAFSGADRLYVGRSSQGTHDGELWAIDNAFVRVYQDFRVWTKPPFFAVAGDVETQFKDADIAVGDYYAEPPPVANAGPGTMGEIDPLSGVLTVAFDAAQSFAVADGATITGYGWDVGDGTVTVGTLSTAQMTATFPPGFRYVSLFVTDSNGKQHYTYVPVLAIDPDDDPCFYDFQATQVLSAGGQTVEFEIYSDIPAATYPDGTLVMFAVDEPADPSDRSHMWFIGWHQSDPAALRSTREATLRDTTLHCVDAIGRMEQLRAYSVIIDNEAYRDTTVDPAVTWDYMTTPNMDKLLHYLLHWHSTVLDVVDWFPSGTWADFPFRARAADGANLYEQVNAQCRFLTPDYLLTCNRQGQLQVKPDLMLQAQGDRVYSGVSLDADDMADIRWTARSGPSVYELFSGAMLVTTADQVDTVFCIAPGKAPGAGVQRVERGENLARSQANLNSVEGWRYARLNASTSHFEISLAGSDDQGLEPADVEQVAVSLPAEVAAQRGLTLSSELGMVHELTIRHRATREAYWRDISLTWERPVNAVDAVTVILPESDDPPPDDEYWPPNDGNQPGITYPIETPFTPNLPSGQNQVVMLSSSKDAAGNFVYRTNDFQTPSSSGGPTWEAVSVAGVTDSEFYSWVVDPFSPGYRDLGTAINGWVAGETALWRVEDLFGTATASEAVAFPAALDLSGDTRHSRTVQASFGRYFAEEADNPWVMVVSHYGDSAGHSGTWCTYSVDGGQTWSDEVQIAAGFYTVDPGDPYPLGLWLSPRTPGLAYAAAYTSVGNPPAADVYVTEDWGATWTRLALDLVEDPAQPLPRWVLTEDNSYMNTVVGADASNFSHKRTDAPDMGGYGPSRGLILVPPCNVARIELAGSWSASVDAQGNHALSTDVNFGIGYPLWWGGSHDFAFSEPAAAPGSSSGSFTATVTPYGTQNPNSCDVDYIIAHVGDWTNTTLDGQAAATLSGDGVFSEAFVGFSLAVTEIELTDGTVYAPPSAYALDPVNHLAGEIYVPWHDNASEALIYHGALTVAAALQYRLKRAENGVVSDISPSDGSRFYGPNRYGFGIRSYDNNRQYLVMGGTGNDVSADHADDLHALFVSSDYGASWTAIVGPVAESAMGARGGFSAAFASDTPNGLFLWGQPDTQSACIAYTDNFGVDVDDRRGNLATLITAGDIDTILGIAGGPL